jgi:hypothetical protein
MSEYDVFDQSSDDNIQSCAMDAALRLWGEYEDNPTLSDSWGALAVR